jgi:tetratricopeptide (TPR) repeat protein
MSDKTWITGEFVETVQLQVVCQTLINKLAPNATVITREHLEAYGNLDKALQVFYEDSLKEVIEKTREVLRSKGESELKEGVLRNWFEKKLITPAQTRGLAYRGATHTEGLLNEAVDVLDQAHIIREERRGSGRWYELSHDRFIDPIRTSNKEWLLQFSGAAKTRQWLEEKAVRWSRRQDEVDLLGENELSEVERWVASAEAAELGYDPVVTNLMQASRANIKSKQRQRELEVESTKKLEKSARQFKWASVGLAAMFILAVVTTLIASDQWRRANNSLVQVGVSEKSALDWANREFEAKTETAKRAVEAEKARQDAEKAKDDAIKAREEAEKAKDEAVKAREDAESARSKLADALKKAEDRAREAERARKTDRLSREAFRLSRRPESREEAVAQFSRAIDVYRQTGDRDAEADSYLNQGQVYRDMGEEERAEEAFNKAVGLYRGHHPFKHATTLNNIGIIYTSVSSDNSNPQANEEFLANAKTKFYGALTIFRAEKDSFGEAATLSNLAEAQLNMTALEDRRRAIDYYSQAGDIYERYVEKNPAARKQAMRALAVMMASAGNKLSLLGEEGSFDFNARMETYAEALALFRELKDQRGMAATHVKMAGVAEEAAETADADVVEGLKQLIVSNYTKSAQLYKAAGDPIGEASAHLMLGDYYRVQEERAEWRKTIGEYHEALAIYQRLQDRAGQVRAYKLLYQFYAQSSDNDDKAEAIKVLLKTNELYEALGNIRGQSDIYLKLGLLHESRAARREAEAAFNQAVNLYRSSGDRKSEADILSEIGGIYAKSKDQAGLDLAVERLTHAATIYHEMGSKEAAARTYDLLGEIYRDRAWTSSNTLIQASTVGYLKAIDYYLVEANVYAAKESKSDTAKLARIMRTIALVYRDRLGDKDKAAEYLDKSLKLYEEAKSASMVRQLKLEIDRLSKPAAAPTKP